jgi:hypothetical protein
MIDIILDDIRRCAAECDGWIGKSFLSDEMKTAYGELVVRRKETLEL